MRNLSSTLAAAQKQGARHPYPKVEVFDSVAAITRYSWTRLYEGNEADYFHSAAITAPPHRNLTRIRVDPNDHKLYRQWIMTPTEQSDYSQWTDWGVASYATAVACKAVDLICFRIGTDGHLYRCVSTSYGYNWGNWIDMGDISADESFRLATCWKDTCTLIVVYSDGSDVYRSRLTWDGEQSDWVPESFAKWSKSQHSITGLAAFHQGDWNIIVTGEEAASGRPGVWTYILGDGYCGAEDTWYGPKELTVAEADSGLSYRFPSLAMPDVFRAFFVEAYSGTESYSRPYWTHSLATADFNDNRWREPVPFDLSSEYGLAFVCASPYAWLSRPDGVWRVPVSAASVDITQDLVHLNALTYETSGALSLTLRNDDGRFASIGEPGDDYEAVNVGSEIRFSPGLITSEGPEVSAGLAYWITEYEYVSQGGRAYLRIAAHDGWTLLDRWRARRTHAWNAGGRNIFQLLSYIFARVGLEFSSFSSSSAITDQEPAFTIHPGESGKTAVLRLLSTVPDVLYFRGQYGYLLHPESSDPTDYIYGTDHQIIEGSYSRRAHQANRAQVTGADVFTEDWSWDELHLAFDLLAQAHDLNLDTTDRAHERGQAILRDAEIHACGGYIEVPLNCGQELYDVVEIADARAGLVSAQRRVLGLAHTYAPRKGQYTLKIALGAM